MSQGEGGGRLKGTLIMTTPPLWFPPEMSREGMLHGWGRSTSECGRTHQAVRKNNLDCLLLLAHKLMLISLRVKALSRIHLRFRRGTLAPTPVHAEEGWEAAHAVELYDRQ